MANVSTAQVIDDHALVDLCPAKDCAQLAAPLRLHPYRLVFTAMPFAPATKQDFYEVIAVMCGQSLRHTDATACHDVNLLKCQFIADYLSLVFIVVYLYAVFNACQTFIIEKETRIREALRMQCVAAGAAGAAGIYVSRKQKNTFFLTPVPLCSTLICCRGVGNAALIGSWSAYKLDCWLDLSSRIIFSAHLF